MICSFLKSRNFFRKKKGRRRRIFSAFFPRIKGKVDWEEEEGWENSGRRKSTVLALSKALTWPKRAGGVLTWIRHEARNEGQRGSACK